MIATRRPDHNLEYFHTVNEKNEKVEKVEKVEKMKI